MNLKKLLSAIVKAVKAHPTIATAVAVTVVKKVDSSLGKKVESALPVIVAATVKPSDPA